MRTIKQFLFNEEDEKKVYFYFEDDETCKRFYRDAEAEGITFCGDRPTEKETTDIIAYLPEGEICYVGWAGRMCYATRGEGVIRINYKKYADGEADYLV